MKRYETSLNWRMVAALCTAAFLLLCQPGVAHGEKKGKSSDSSLLEVEGAELSAFATMTSDRITPFLDGGTARGMGDFSFSSRTNTSYSKMYATAVPWKQEGASDTAMKLDVVGLEIGADLRREVKDRSVGFRIPFGAYYPLRWKKDFSDLYQIPRVYLGASLFVQSGFLNVEGGGQYYWPSWESGEVEVDNVKLSLFPGEFWQAHASGRLDILGLVGPVGEIGIFGFPGATVKGPMSKQTLDSESVSYLSFGVSIAPVPDALFIEARVNQVVGKPDMRAIEYATGRRAMRELWNGYSIGLVGRL